MLFCGISFKHPYMQSDRWQDVLDMKHIKNPKFMSETSGTIMI
jgi:hypothetical protein